MILPGFGSAKVSVPEDSSPPPEREDPQVVEARKKLRQSELKRKGRAASILTTREERQSEPSIARPQASGKLG